RGVDRAALRIVAPLGVALVDLGQVEPAAEDGRDVAVPPGPLAGLVHVARDAGVALEIPVDVALRLAALDAELAREAERGHAIDEAEVDRLRGAALIGRDVRERHVEHLRGRRAVDVLTLSERGEE